MSEPKGKIPQKAAPGKAAPGKLGGQRSWRSMASLTRDAIEALDAGNLQAVRQYLEAMRGVAMAAFAAHGDD